MANDKNRTAYIDIEREENSLKYFAKVFNEPPREITKHQYNAIVKALNEQDWRNIEEDEPTIINRIINSQLNSNEIN